ncbi:MAG: iron-containing alcohol dehydrogenase [Bryobacterales bacterium]|nr:iron-containing alcohol dehydrogenase [Bryobacterales bacterium]
MTYFERARKLIADFKGPRYRFGFGVLGETGRMAVELGRRALVVRDGFPGSDAAMETILDSLHAAGVEVVAVVDGAAPNAPLEDLARITELLREHSPDVLVSFGGGSTIDCVKAAEVLRTLGGDIEEYFGMGLVTSKLASAGKRLTPHLAIQTASSSAAHLTKYSNITNVATGQKKLIVDEAIVPDRALFDHEVTLTSPLSLTADGALDGLSHCLEVYYGATGKANFGRVEEVGLTGIELVCRYLPRVTREPDHREGREALSLATDLGGYAIMLGGTNGAHLTSFSLVDILSHGRACALMNPYYTVFYSPAVQQQLERVADIASAVGLAPPVESRPAGRHLAEQVGTAIMRLEQQAGNPVTLGEVQGFSRGHVDRALTAAKNPQLRMKLENMPVPLKAEQVDDFMGPVLEAAAVGEFGGIRNLS